MGHLSEECGVKKKPRMAQSDVRSSFTGCQIDGCVLKSVVRADAVNTADPMWLLLQGNTLKQDDVKMDFH